MKTINLFLPVETFVVNAYFSPYYVREAAQKILRDYNTYKDLYIKSVDIYNCNGSTVFNIHFNNYSGLSSVHTLRMFKPNFSISDYDFRSLRTYFKSYRSH